MSRPRFQIPWFFLWAGLLFLSLRPVPLVQQAVDAAVVPLRALAELASPLGVVRGGVVMAAEDRLARAAGDEARENQRLLADLARTALPTLPGLLANRRVVHAEVLGREAGMRDHLEIRLRDTRGLVKGLPVACGNVYVGRLEEISPAQETAVVKLVTASGFHVGARVPVAGADDVLMTVGGVREIDGHGVLLDVHHPSDRQLEGGAAWVHEHFDDAEAFGSLAEGLFLGEVRRLSPGGPWGVVPELDYLDGLFQVVVLAPSDPGLGSAAPFEPVLMDERWVETRPLGTGDPDPWRSAAKVAAGRLRGVLPGAAVTSIGARLIGRVTHAGLVTSDVSFLADPGFTLVAVGRFEDEPMPRVLGRLVSEGAEEDGRIRFRWIVRVGLALDPERGGTRRAELFTGSGDPGLPAGFRFGQALVPVDAKPGEVRTLRVETDLDPTHVRHLFLRTSDRDSGGGAP